MTMLESRSLTLYVGHLGDAAYGAVYRPTDCWAVLPATDMFAHGIPEEVDSRARWMRGGSNCRVSPSSSKERTLDLRPASRRSQRWSSTGRASSA
jgi:hypothetical protein